MVEEQTSNILGGTNLVQSTRCGRICLLGLSAFQILTLLDFTSSRAHRQHAAKPHNAARSSPKRFMARQLASCRARIESIQSKRRPVSSSASQLTATSAQSSHEVGHELYHLQPLAAFSSHTSCASLESSVPIRIASSCSWAPLTRHRWLVTAAYSRLVRINAGSRRQ